MPDIGGLGFGNEAESRRPRIPSPFQPMTGWPEAAQQAPIRLGWLQAARRLAVRVIEIAFGLVAQLVRARA